MNLDKSPTVQVRVILSHKSSGITGTGALTIIKLPGDRIPTGEKHPFFAVECYRLVLFHAHPIELPVVSRVTVLARANMGLGSYRAQSKLGGVSWAEGSKCHTLTKFSSSIKGARPIAGVMEGAGVGVGANVGVAGTSGSRTLKLENDLTPPTVEDTTLTPGGSTGTTPVMVKPPSASVVWDDCKIVRTPMVTSEIVRKARKLIPVTVTVVPLGPDAGATEVVAAGTEWSTVTVDAVPTIVAVTVFVEGIRAAVGTRNVTSNLPSVSGVTDVRLFEPYVRLTRKLFGERTLAAGNPTPLTFTLLPMRLSVSSRVIFRVVKDTLAVADAPPVSLATNCRLDVPNVAELPSMII